MIDPITAVSLAEAIASFSELAIKVLKLLKHYSDTAHELPSGALADIRTQLPVLVHAVEIVRDEASTPAGSMLTPAKAGMVKAVADGCAAQLEELAKLVEKVLGAHGTVRKTLYTLKNEGRVEALQKSLQSYISVLVLHRVVQLPVGETRGDPVAAVSYYEVPVRRGADFVPREDIMHSVDEFFKPAALSQVKTPTIVLLRGPKGAGKKQIALEYCRQVHEDGRFKSVFWIDATSHGGVVARFEALAAVLRQSGEGKREAALEVQFVKDFLAGWWHPWLMVFENCSADMLDRLTEFVPQTACAAVLCTTVEHTAISGASVIHVKPFFSAERRQQIDTTLWRAVNDNNVARVREVLERGADPNTRDPRSNWPLLHRAAHDGHHGIVDELLKAGANPLLSTYGGIRFNADGSAAAWGADTGDTALLVKMLEKEHAFKLVGEDHNHNAVLMIALGSGVASRRDKSGQEKVVQLLLTHPLVKLDFDKWNDPPPLIRALERPNLASITLLLDHGLKVDEELKHGSSYSTPLYEAVRTGYLDGARLFCSRGANPFRQGHNDAFAQTPFTRAVSEGRLDMLEMFVGSTKGDISTPDPRTKMTALHMASYTGEMAIAKFLLDRGAQLNGLDAESNTPLILAAERGHEEVAKLLLAQPGIQADTCNVNHQTALHLAVKKGYIGIVSALISAATDIDRADEDSNTPLLLAVFNNNSRIVRMLVRHGADPNTMNKNGDAALLYAADKGHAHLVALLLGSQKGHFNIRDHDGDTALSLAAHAGHFEVVQILVKHHTVEDVENALGETALDRAEDAGHADVVRVLKDWLASKGKQ